MLRKSLVLGLLVAFGCGDAERRLSSGGDAAVGGDDLAVPDLGGPPSVGPLQIMPQDPVVTVTAGQTPTVQFTATVDGVSWTIDRGELGSIGVGGGLFTPTGTIGGKATVTATLGTQQASTSVTVILQQTQNGDPDYKLPLPAPGTGGYGGVGGDGPAPGASADQQTSLSGTPKADSNVKILYPYDGTVWPRGLLPPLIQWNAAGHDFDSIAIQLRAKTFTYSGTFAKNPNLTTFKNLPIPEAVWKALTYSNGGKNDDITVTIVFAEGSNAFGPYTLTWHIAPATLKGTVYYNTYGTALVQNSGQRSCGPADTNCDAVRNDMTGPYFGAAIVAIKPGATEPSVVAGTTTPTNGTAGSSDVGCRVCHAVSTNGAKLITQRGDYTTSSAYDLLSGNLESGVSGINHSYPAVWPDGSWFLSSSGGMVNTDTTSQAYTFAGALLNPQPTGLPVGFRAALPVFSPDGKHLAFNFFAPASSGADARSLWTLDYDVGTKTFLSTSLRRLHTPTSGVDSWSSWLPTNSGVVFQNELSGGGATSTNFNGASFGFTRYGGQGVLWWVDATTGTAAPLDRLNGKGYLPTYGNNHTTAGDALLNYEPTVNPVVSGGYAWVVFTSRRLYGNVATADPYLSDPRNYDWTEPAKVGFTPKKLWVAAIDINAMPGTDPSYPAFYLPAQELQAGNARGFWTVDPCHAAGTACDSGDECCGGYCSPGGDGGALVCSQMQPTCSAPYDKCTQSSECCGAAQGIQCINGFCTDLIQ
jgi:hypothetical protein